MGNITNPLLPNYSQSLVELVRLVNSAELAVRTSSWSFSSLRDDDQVYVEGDGSLHDWACIRLRFLRDQIEASKKIINDMIISESLGYFNCITDEHGNLRIPHNIHSLLSPKKGFRFTYTSTDDALTKAASTIEENYLVLFEGDAYLLPRTIQKNIIEIWWTKQFFDCESQTNYTMALVEKHYGWDCYGHEL